MAAPMIKELLERIERLEARSGAAVTSPAGEAAESQPCPTGMTRRGVVTAAAAGTAGIVSAVLLESGGAASALTAGPFAYRVVARRKAVTAPRLNRVTPPKARAVRS